jgi:chorismate synthase
LHRTNAAGGLTGGISNGEPIVVRGAVKPISTLARPLPSADLRTGEPVDVAHYERSDISVVPAAGVIGEAMVLLTLTRFVLEKFGGDSLLEVRDNLARYRERTLALVDATTGDEAGPAAGEAETGSGGDD